MAEPSRRERIANYYRGPVQLTEKLASSASQYGFRQNAVVPAAVVRVDLNGYSKWALEKGIDARVALLNDYFSKVVPMLHAHGGIYYRDEGDCIVGLFSNYFVPGLLAQSVLAFAKVAVGARYGVDQLAVKAVIAVDDVAIYQKSHEVNSSDWSAEGQLFVTAARIESAVDSKPRIYMRKEDYETNFDSGAPKARFGDVYWWTMHEETLPISGLGAKPNGRVPLVYLEHVPEGRLHT
jgi:hypothetical protein